MWRVDQHAIIDTIVLEGNVMDTRKWLTAGIYRYKKDALLTYRRIKRLGDKARMRNFKKEPKYIM